MPRPSPWRLLENARCHSLATCRLVHIEDIPWSGVSDLTLVATDNEVALERAKWERLGSDVVVAYGTEVPSER